MAAEYAMKYRATPQEDEPTKTRLVIMDALDQTVQERGHFYPCPQEEEGYIRAKEGDDWKDYPLRRAIIEEAEERTGEYDSGSRRLESFRAELVHRIEPWIEGDIMFAGWAHTEERSAERATQEEKAIELIGKEIDRTAEVLERVQAHPEIEAEAQRIYRETIEEFVIHPEGENLSPWRESTEVRIAKQIEFRNRILEESGIDPKYINVEQPRPHTIYQDVGEALYLVEPEKGKTELEKALLGIAFMGEFNAVWNYDRGSSPLGEIPEGKTSDEYKQEGILTGVALTKVVGYLMQQIRTLEQGEED